MRVLTKDLPESIQACLKAVEFGGRDVEVAVATEESKIAGGATGDGWRSFFGVVNLTTGDHKVSWGSWGGMNPYEAKAADYVSDAEISVRAGFAIVVGSRGGAKPQSYPTVYIHASNVVAGMLESGKALEGELASVLRCYRELKSGTYREEGLMRVAEHYNPDANYAVRKAWIAVQQMKLEELGYLKTSKSGAKSLTLEGKNVKVESPRIYL